MSCNPMIETTIQHACGHKREYAIGINDREWWLEFIKKTICPKCFEKKLKKKASTPMKG